MALDEATRWRVRRLEEDLDLELLAEWLGMAKPKGSSCWRWPKADSKPTVSFYEGNTSWWDIKLAIGGTGMDLIMQCRGCDDAAAVLILHEYKNVAMPKAEEPVRDTRSQEQVVADRVMSAADLALPYLVEQRRIPEAIVKAAIKAGTVGFSTWTSSNIEPNNPGYGGPAAAFVVRTTNPGHVVAVDMSYISSELNGGEASRTVGAEAGNVWMPIEPRKLWGMKTVYIVDTPINALSVLACGLKLTTAIAVRAADVDAVDWNFLAGKHCVICMGIDEPDEDGKRKWQAAAWKLYDLLTARNIAAVLVDQSKWEEEEFVDPNQILVKAGPEELNAKMRKLEDCAIAGLPSELNITGKKRVFLPAYDWAAYWRFKAQADYTDYVKEAGNEDEGKKPDRIPLAGFRLAALTKITVQCPQATTQGTEDVAPAVMFAASVQVPRHGAQLVRRVMRDEELHKPAKWQDFGPIYQPQYFQRMVAMFERTTHLGSREAANFVGVCWLNGKLVVNEGPDCYFEQPDKQCAAYHELRFQRGPASTAAQVIAAYKSTFTSSAALIPLIWILGAAGLKCLLGFWPHMEVQAAKGSGKSTLTTRLGSTTGFTMFSSQQLKTEYRIVSSVSHTSLPVGWDEMSANDMKVIERAVNTLQECYQFTPHVRGSDNLRFLNSAPVLLAGEDVPVRSLAGKIVRTTLSPDKRGAEMSKDLPAFPMRAWLDWVVKLRLQDVRARFDRLAEHCKRTCRATGVDVGVQRMATNYAAVLLAWKLLCEFAKVDDAGDQVQADLLAEMNQHIADTSEDREPYIWILEKLASEITAGRFLYPREYEKVLNKQTGIEEMCLLVRPTHVMEHLSTAQHLRDWFSGLPVKTSRVFKTQCMAAGLVIDDDVNFTYNNARHFHALALSIKSLDRKGISVAIPNTRLDPPVQGPRPGDIPD